MQIVADENIPLVKEAFSHIGTVKTVNGRALCAEDVKHADILLVRSVSKVNRSLLENSPVKFVASATIGFDHVDLDYLKQRKTGFARAPASNAISASEYIVTAISWWAKKAGKKVDQLSLGIIGCGNVGSRVKKRAEILGMQCLANDPPLADQGVQGLCSIEEALACDVITLHVPLSKEGKYPSWKLLDESRLSQIKPGSLLLNAARGYTIDEAALKKHTEIDLILDCWEGEPNIDHQLLDRALLATAHIAGYSLDGKLRGTEMIYLACCQFFGIEPRWSVEQVALEAPPTIQGFDEIGAILKRAYLIEEDSDRLKAILQGMDKPAAYFDQLRKNYPVRREFSQWTVDASLLARQDREKLKQLGFRLV